MFAGSADLLKSDKPVERVLILQVAKSYGLPAMCVNVLGGLPYINKDGLLFKLEEYEGKNIVSLTSKAIQYAKVPGERAIFESTLILKDAKGRERTFTATGEADNASVKLEAVKATPNMMAETRSVNRVLGKAIKARMLKDLYIALGRAKGITETEKEIIESAVQTSTEEMNVSPSKGNNAGGTISREALVKLSLEKIQAENSKTMLAEYRQKIETSPAFTEGQKKTLYNLIDQKIRATK